VRRRGGDFEEKPTAKKIRSYRLTNRNDNNTKRLYAVGR
jgi:hypothetical protein